MKTTLDLSADTIDVRDIIERVEELEELQELGEHVETPDCELTQLRAILEDLAGNGGDEQWRGEWYPVTLIDYQCFTPYVQEMLEDCGTIPKDLPYCVHIDWDATAREVMVDYSIVTIEGRDYLYR